MFPAIDVCRSFYNRSRLNEPMRRENLREGEQLKEIVVGEIKEAGEEYHSWNLK